ncbi:hypothetical protein cyc_06502 [Cyclospora cayetanensis]|uniref:Uncharacterized protein n=1 Tax=Cyclospora cayetanensis TaxID=88456 RepID=A0A1D3D6S7_9EIME|nr:hypothetical protein cyc_06502 [Cyclospora cayetanensis]
MQQQQLWLQLLPRAEKQQQPEQQLGPLIQLPLFLPQQRQQPLLPLLLHRLRLLHGRLGCCCFIRSSGSSRRHFLCAGRGP